MCTRRDECAAAMAGAIALARGTLSVSLRVQIAGLVAAAAAPEERKWPNLNGRSF